MLTGERLQAFKSFFCETCYWRTIKYIVTTVRGNATSHCQCIVTFEIQQVIQNFEVKYEKKEGTGMGTREDHHEKGKKYVSEYTREVLVQ